jgi:hypothetical protein
MRYRFNWNCFTIIVHNYPNTVVICGVLLLAILTGSGDLFTGRPYPFLDLLHPW